LFLFLEIIPSTERSSVTHAKPIPPHLKPLVSRAYNEILASLDVLCPLLLQTTDTSAPLLFSSASEANSSHFISPVNYSQSIQPRILICGASGMGQRILGAAALEMMESKKFYVQSLDLPAILNDSGRNSDTALIQIVSEVRRHRPAVLYIPEVDIWWRTVSDSAHIVLRSLISSDPLNPFVLLATSETEYADLPEELQALIAGRTYRSIGNMEQVEGWKRVIEARAPSEVCIRNVNEYFN
jgi:hypothetical protein